MYCNLQTKTLSMNWSPFSFLFFLLSSFYILANSKYAHALQRKIGEKKEGKKVTEVLVVLARRQLPPRWPESTGPGDAVSVSCVCFLSISSEMLRMLQ
jgi:hypothetical protein